MDRLIERKRKKAEDTEDYLSLLPEVARLTGYSLSSLENYPMEIKVSLVKTYVNQCNADDATIREALSRLINLDMNATSEVQKAYQEKEQSNNTPDKRNEIRFTEQELDRSSMLERERIEKQYQTVKEEEQRTIHFSRSRLKNEAARIRDRNVIIEGQERML